MARFTAEWKVGWPEVDLAGIVYFPRFLGFFEHAELEWVRSHGLKYMELLDKLGVLLPRASAHCDYHAPAKLDDLLSIEMRLVRLGKTSFTFGFEAFRQPEKTRLASGYIVIAAVSRERFRPVRIPAELEGMLLALADAETERAASSA